ncbi:hypothetical protein [Thalassotalea marina]|uniref:Uncharacterized protein n=1 Tax=Thalassotalea marina TaxID=1673741 RepID=A0A919BL04_9GAMM|nr:hypothetical protein [Thalassotalea marina]GHF95821.1 hypothetical protein GCM10017161_25170 [Thalassotalea marina]
MRNILKNKLLGVFGIFIAWSISANASLIQNYDKNGQLMGVDNIGVYNFDIDDWILYDVKFVDGKFQDLFGVSGEQIAATDYTDALMFSFALQFSVFENNSILNTTPSLVNGCSSTISCTILSPFHFYPNDQFSNAFSYSSLFTNNATSENNRLLIQQYIANVDLTNKSDQTWAKWTLTSERSKVTVPEPSSFLIVFVGFILFLYRKNKVDQLLR